MSLRWVVLVLGMRLLIGIVVRGLRAGLWTLLSGWGGSWDFPPFVQICI
ncbi:hypothetical protein ACFQ60_47475 [Streptomyces zhihengii]